MLACVCLSSKAYSQKSNSGDANADSLIAKARELQESGDAESSLSLLNQALEIRTFAPSATLEQWAEVVNMQAVSYSMKYEWLKAIKICYDAYRRIIQNPRSRQYAISLYNLATFYAGQGNEGDYEKAILYALQANEKFDRNTRRYFDGLNNLVYYYILNNDEDRAMDIIDRAITSGEPVFKDDPREYTKQLWKGAKSIAELEKYTVALEYGKATLNVMEQNGMNNTREYFRRLISVAGYYYQLRDFRSEISILEKAMPVAQSVSGDESRDYVDCLRKLALAYNHQANDVRDKKDKKEYEHCREQNEHYEDLSREILIRTGRLAEIRTYQIPLISNKASELYKQNKFDEAIKYELIAYQLYEGSNSKPDLARTGNNLGIYYYENQDLPNALKYGRIATDLYDGIEASSRNKGMAYNNMSLFYHDNGQAKEAVDYSLKSIKAFEQAGDTLSDLYIKALGNAGVYYHEVGDDRNAAIYSERSVAVQNAQFEARQNAEKAAAEAQAKKRRKKKNDQPAPVQAAKPVMDNNAVTVQWNRAIYAQGEAEIHEAYSKAISFQREAFFLLFPTLPSDTARREEWEKRKFIYDYAETLAFSYAENDSIVSDAYNAILIREGMPRFVQSLDTAAVMRSWQDVTLGLDSTAAVVHFFYIPTENKGDAYSAIILRSGWTAPRIVKQLFTDYDLQFLTYGEEDQPFAELVKSADGRKQIAADPRLGRMVWTRVLDAIGDVQSIRYTTTRLLNDVDPARLSIDPSTTFIRRYAATRQ